MSKRPDYVKEPFMGNISLSRTSGNGQVMFDSPHAHQHVISMTISTAYRKHDLSRDWIFPEDRIVQLDMTEAQWAKMVSSIGMGSGTPVTLKYTQELGVIAPPVLEVENRTSLFKKQVSLNIVDAVEALFGR